MNPRAQAVEFLRFMGEWFLEAAQRLETTSPLRPSTEEAGNRAYWIIKLRRKRADFQTLPDGVRYLPLPEFMRRYPEP